MRVRRDMRNHDRLLASVEQRRNSGTNRGRRYSLGFMRGGDDVNLGPHGVLDRCRLVLLREGVFGFGIRKRVIFVNALEEIFEVDWVACELICRGVGGRATGLFGAS